MAKSPEPHKRRRPDVQTAPPAPPAPTPMSRTPPPVVRRKTLPPPQTAAGPAKPAPVTTDKPVQATKPAKPAGPPAISIETLDVYADHRKMTKALKSDIHKALELNLGRNRDALMDAMMDAVKKETGDELIMLGRDTDKLIVTLDCLPLVFEALIAQDGLPLGLVIQLVSEPGTGKSGLLADIMGRAHAVGAFNALVEAEDKHNPIWFRAFMTDDAYDRMLYAPGESIEGWQRKMTATVKVERNILLKGYGEGKDKVIGVGKRIPFVNGVDSVSARQSEETVEKIWGEETAAGGRGSGGTGSAGRGHPVEAMSITRYVRTVSHEIARWPIALILINQVRKSSDQQGKEVRTKTGGKQLEYQQSYEIELEKGAKVHSATMSGYVVKMKSYKNSFSPDRRIETRLLWRYEPDPMTGKNKQICWWDWDWALINHMNFLQESPYADPQLREAFHRSGFHIDCPKVGPIENLAWSKTIGMKNKDSAVPWAELGRMFQADPAIVDILRDALLITKRTRFRVGADLDDVRQSAADKMT